MPSTSISARFDVHNPATGEIVDSYPVRDTEQVRAAVARAREARTGGRS